MAGATTDRHERLDAYAKALFEVARAEGVLPVVERELFAAARAFDMNDELKTTLIDPGIPADRRQGIAEQLLGGKAHPLTVALVSFIVGAGRARDLTDIANRVAQSAAQEQDQELAEVRSAIPLDDTQRERLAEALGKATGKKVTVRVIVDPTVLGGIVARVGDTVIDGSVRHRLNQLRASL